MFSDMEAKVKKLIKETEILPPSFVQPTIVTIAKASTDEFYKNLLTIMNEDTMYFVTEWFMDNGVKLSIDNIIEAFGLEGVKLDTLDIRMKEMFTSLRQYSDKTIDRLRREVYNAIKISTEIGESKVQLENRIVDMFEFFKEVEAPRTAVTFNTAAFNWARYTAMSDDTRITTKMWITAGDEKVRPTHMALHKTVIPIAERFANGLLYPGDPSGAPQEVIHCRCAIIPGENSLDIYDL